MGRRLLDEGRSGVVAERSVVGGGVGTVEETAAYDKIDVCLEEDQAPIQRMFAFVYLRCRIGTRRVPLQFHAFVDVRRDETALDSDLGKIGRYSPSS